MGQATNSAMARGRVGNGLGVGIGGESIDGAVFDEVLEGEGLGGKLERSGILISRSKVSERGIRVEVDWIK